MSRGPNAKEAVRRDRHISECPLRTICLFIAKVVAGQVHRRRPGIVKFNPVLIPAVVIDVGAEVGTGIFVDDNLCVRNNCEQNYCAQKLHF